MPPSEGEPTREYLCKIAEKLAHSPFFGIVIGKLVVALIGFICSTYTFLNEGIKWLVHPNAKVLFFSHALITVFTAVVYIGVYSFEIYRISFPQSGDCAYLLSDVTAFWVRFPMNTLFCLQTVIMFTFVVERTISTIWPEEYEQISNPKHCIIICFVVMSAGVAFTFCLLALPNNYEGYSTAVGAKTKDNFFEGSIAVMETATMGILYWSTVESIRQTKELQRRKESHLGNKYQISENRNILLLLLPCFTINGLLHLFSSCEVIVYSFISENKFQPEIEFMSAAAPPTDEVCQVAENIAHSFLPIAICKASVAVIGLVASTYTFLSEGLKWLVHPNAKVIFFNHALLTVISAIVYFCEYSFEVYRILFPAPGPCGYILNAHTAFWVRMPLNLLICLQTSNMFIFVIERAIATVYPEQYEKLNRPKDAIIACSVVTLFGIFYTLALLALPNKYNYWSTAVTVKTPENYYTLWLVSILIIEVVSNSILVSSTIATLRRRSELKRHKRSQLGSKYQVSENRNILLLLLPCFSLHSVFQLFTAGGIIGYNIIAKEFDPATSAMVAEIFNQFLLYTIIIPVVMFVQKKFFRRQNVVDSQLKTDDYFKQLHGLWK